MKNHQTNKQTHRPLFIIIALSILPIILAILFYKIRYVGAGYTNHGTLLTPPLQLNTFKLIDCQNQHKQWFFEPGKWRLIYLAPQKCDPGCLNNLTQLNQVYRALGKRQNRVQTVAIFYPQSYPQSLPKYVSISCQTSKNAQLQKKRFNAKKLSISKGSLMIADPNGNIMLVYPHHFWQEILFKDFKHLLKHSQIG